MKKGIMPARPLCFGWSGCSKQLHCDHGGDCLEAMWERVEWTQEECPRAMVRVLLRENDELLHSLWTKCIQCDELIDEAIELKADLEETRGNMEALGFV